MQKLGIYILLAIFLNLICGCNLYKVYTYNNVSKGKLKILLQKNRYFIIHENDTVWHLNSPFVSKNNLIGDKAILAEWHKSYKMNPQKTGNKYDRKDEHSKQVVKEAHIYTPYVISMDTTRVIIPIDSVKYIQIYQSRNTTIIGTTLLGIGIAATIIIPLIIYNNLY